jgi:hypothetical protein
VGLPNEALKERDQWQGNVKDRPECSSPNINKRPSTCLTESGGMGARTNQRGKATASSSPVEEHGVGHDEEDSKPSLVTIGARIVSREIPYGWIRVKLEPDC